MAMRRLNPLAHGAHDEHRLRQATGEDRAKIETAIEGNKKTLTGNALADYEEGMKLAAAQHELSK